MTLAEYQRANGILTRKQEEVIRRKEVPLSDAE